MALPQQLSNLVLRIFFISYLHSKISFLFKDFTIVNYDPTSEARTKAATAVIYLYERVAHNWTAGATPVKHGGYSSGLHSAHFLHFIP